MTSHFDYEQFLRQRGLVSSSRNRKSAASGPRPFAAPSDSSTAALSDVNPASKPASPQHTDNLDDEFFNYDLPTCNWAPGASAAYCGEGVICPPCG